MAVTIRDVAKRLKLSITTVSRALDGYDDVADKTRQRVTKAAREMGYAPSRAARQLRRQQADAIGYILPASGSHFTDPFFSEFIAGLGDVATSHNYDLLVSTAEPDSVSERALYERWVRSRLIDGIVLSRMRLQDWRAKYLCQNKFPVVAHGHTHQSLSFPYIEVDSRAGFALLVKHMIERGHRRIAYIGAPSKFTLQTDRLDGYRDGLTAAGIPFDATLITEGDLSRTGGYEAAFPLLDLPHPPTALIGVNDLTAIGAMRAARERGLIIGKDIAIAGYDGTDDSEHTQPPLTTLRQEVYGIAQQLAQMLIASISGERIECKQIIQPQLIARESTGG